MRYAIRRVNTRVLPDPAPATTRSGPPLCETAALCWGFNPSSKDLFERADMARSLG